MRLPIVTRSWTAALFTVALASPSRGETDVADSCASRAEHGQVARRSGRLIEARGDFLACAEDACPKIVRQDCAEWSVELEGEIPSVVLSARDARGHDVVGVHVSVDGRELLQAVGGDAVPMDPGLHALRFEARSGAVREEHVVLRLGERRRAISVQFAEALTIDGTPAALLAPAPAGRPSFPATGVAEPGPKRPSYTLGYVFGAAALAAAGVFGYFEATAQSHYGDMDRGCGRTGTCNPGDVSSLRAEFVAADSFIGVSAVCAAVSIWYFLSPPTAHSTNARGTFVPTARGAIVLF